MAMTENRLEDEKLKVAFDYLYQTYFGDEQIEKDEIDNLPILLDGCDLFIDVGASLGMYTFFANRFLNNATIIAIEADPDRFNELRRNCLKWEKEGNNSIIAVHAVAGDSNEKIQFFKTGTHISGSLFKVPGRFDNYKTVEVNQVMLDDFYKYSTNTSIKIDVEGVEYRVLLGATRLLMDTNTKFSIGIHSWGDLGLQKTPMDLLRLLYLNKYTITKTSTRMTSNYIFTHSECGHTFHLPSYLKYLPLILARQMYRQILPRSLARTIDSKLNAFRVNRISRQLRHTKDR